MEPEDVEDVVETVPLNDVDAIPGLEIGVTAGVLELADGIAMLKILDDEAVPEVELGVLDVIDDEVDAPNDAL